MTDTLTQDTHLTADVVVVGSGAGGSIWASELAKRGVDVLLLEEGGHYTRADFNQRESDMYPLLYRDGANQVTKDQRVSVLQGRCVGGSTVVNMADIERIPDAVLEHWRRLTGVEAFRPATFAPFWEAVEAPIGVNRIPVEMLNRNNSLLKEGTEKLGHHGAELRHNRVGCVGSGYCTIGCSYDAKRSTLVTLIPAAVEAGCRLVSGARVERFEVERGAIARVVGERIEPRSGKVLGRFFVKAKTFVLAAGAVHSPLLLMRSGIDDGPVGRNLSLQPQVPVVAVFGEEVRPFRGIPQAYAHDEFEAQSAEHGLGGFRIEGISGGPAMSAVSIPALGHEQKEFMSRYVNTAAALVLVPDRPGGEVRPTKKGEPADIRYALQDGWIKAARHGLSTAVHVYQAAGAERVIVPGTPPIVFERDGRDLDRIERMSFAAGHVSTISAHPQGTCRMGTDSAKSVVGADGRHHRIKNLIVSDASLFPTSASTHTMVPVMAVSLWLVEQYLATV